jgi:hypothetical protein
MLRTPRTRRRLAGLLTAVAVAAAASVAGQVLLNTTPAGAVTVDSYLW